MIGNFEVYVYGADTVSSLKGLARRGLIEHRPAVPHAYAVTPAGRQYLAALVAKKESAA